MPKNRSMNKMITVIMVIFLLFFLGITGRFIYIQAAGEISDVSLDDWAKDVRETEMILPSERGKIFDENGKLLAYNRPTYRVYAVLNPEMSFNSSTPRHVEDAEETASKLAPILEMDQQEIETIRSEEHTSELQSRGHLV